MAITLICGKSGQGKTAYAVHSLMKYVETSRCLVMSNVPLYFNYIRSWIFVFKIPLSITKRYPFIRKLPFVYNYTFSSNERVVTWSDLEQIYDVVKLCELANKENINFSLEIASVILKWELRGLSFPLPTNKDMYKLGFVLFVDEGASYFNSREFRKTPPEFLYLINQHRKMKIDLILTVQRLGSIDNHIRESAHITLLVRKFKFFFLTLNRWHKVIMIDFDPIEGNAGKRVFYDIIRRSRFVESIYDTMFVIKAKNAISSQQ